MSDVLFLISDPPNKSGGSGQYKLLHEIATKKLKGHTFEAIHVVDKFMDDVKKKDIIKHTKVKMNFIEENHPRVIVALGKEAFMLLGLKNTKVTDICNVPTTSPYFGGVEIQKSGIVTHCGGRGWLYTKKIEGETFTIPLVSHKDIIVYPTYAFKNMLTYACGYKGQSFFERQLDRVVEILEEPNWKPYSIEEYPIILHTCNEQFAVERLEYWAKQRQIAFDIETAGYDIPAEAQLNPNHNQAKISMIGIGNADQVDVFNTYKMPSLIPHINKVFKREKPVNLTWNGKFDIQFMQVKWNTNFSNQAHVDGRACVYLVDMNMQFLGKGAGTLKFASAVFPKHGAKYAGYQKNDGIDVAIKEGNGKYLEDHEKEFMLYCGIDVLLTYRTIKTMWDTMPEKSKKLATTYYQELDDMLREVHSGGIKVNIDLLNKFIEELTKFTGKIEEKIIAFGIKNPKSGPELCEYIYNVRKMPVHYTDKGNLTLTSEILESYNYDPFCKLILDYRSFLKQLEIFIAIRDYTTNGYCYPSYNQYRTTSGRLASTNPPIQIVPQNKKVDTIIPDEKCDVEKLLGRPVWFNNKIKLGEDNKYHFIETSPNFKQIFIPDDGYTLIYSDYAQLEVYILACFISRVSRDDTLQKAIREGRDLHSYTASLLYSTIMNKQYTEDFIKAHKEEEPYKSWRQDSKSVLFKLIYGGTYKSFAIDKNIPEDDAKKIFDTFLQVIPGIQHYMKNQEFLANTKMNVETYPGHVRPLGVAEFYKYNSKVRNIALNHPIQGTASYFVNCAMMKLNEEIKKLGGRILLTVHDSIASQVPHDKLEEGLALQKWCKIDYILETFKEFFSVPLRIDLYYGTNWNDLNKKKG